MKIIVANWKMNSSVNFVHEFVKSINEIKTQNKVVVCPPFPLIGHFADFKHHVGAQNCFYEKSGQYTGEISPSLLCELGVKYVIIGHSERRNVFWETNEDVYKKWIAAIDNKLIPIVCIGEKSEQRTTWRDALHVQMKLFESCDLRDSIFAYEPVWSIGTGFVPTVDEIENVSKFIKDSINCRWLLYGGSVNASNIEHIIKCSNIDGVLVGGASLKTKEFADIILKSE